MAASSGSRLVYSTDSGRVCPDCRQPVAGCTCRSAAKAAPPSDGVVRVAYETKGRGGKGVTVVRGVPLDADALLALGKQLRTACGAGGTTKDHVIEVQGDHRETVTATLQKLGHTVKRVGG